VGKQEVEFDTLSDWELIRKRIIKLSRSMSSKVRSTFNDKGVENLTDIHNNYVVVSVDKPSNNIVGVCKTYYITFL